MAVPVIESAEPKVVLTGEVARQGEAPGHVRWVLFVSIGLFVIAGLVMYAISLS